MACEAQIMSDINVEVLSSQQNNALKILSKGQSFTIEIDPLIKKEYVKDKNITRIFTEEKELGFETGDTTQRNYGIVVDIGTTTLVASLVDLNNGVEIASTSSLNPQAIHAQDVLSRIKLALKKWIGDVVSELIREITAMIHGYTWIRGRTENIYESSLAENLYAASSFKTNPEFLAGSRIRPA